MSQLHEVIAWLASYDAGVLEWVIGIEPEILLKADLPSDNDATRARIVEAILARTQAGALSFMRQRAISTDLDRLEHPGLVEQLRAAIANRQFSDATRGMALTIAEKSKVQNVSAVAADVALDPAESVALRVDAAYAVCRLGEGPAEARLRPLTLLAPAADPNDDLLGLALRACWPQYMTAAQLFDVLRPLRRPTSSGAYSGFLHDQTIAAQLAEADLPSALAWIARTNLDREHWHPLTRIAGQIVTRAFQLDRPDLHALLAPIVYQAYHDFRCPFFAPPLEDRFQIANDTNAVNRMLDNAAAPRRRLLTAIVESIPSGSPFHLMAHSDCPLLRPSDFGWLLDRACEADGERATDWAALARRVMSWVSVEHLDLWLEGIRRCQVVARVLDFPQVTEIESAEGRQAKADYLREQRFQRRGARREVDPAVLAARVQQLLTRTLTDQPELFPSLALELERDEEGFVRHIPCDLADARGWNNATNETRSSIVDAAIEYLVRAAIPGSDPIATLNTWNAIDAASAIALLLVNKERPGALATIPEGAWRTRTPHTLVRLIGFFDCSPEEKAALCALLHEHAPDVCEATLLAILDSPAADNNAWSLMSLWELHLNDNLANELLVRLRNPQVPGQVFSVVARWLLRRHYAPAGTFIRELLRDENPRRLSAAVIAAQEQPEEFWGLIWQLLVANREWGRSFLETLVNAGDEGTRLLPTMAADNIGRLLSWVLTEYPPDDGDIPDDGVVGVRDHIRFFRHALTEILRQAGTRESCAAIRAVRDEHPEQPWLSEVLLEAEAAERRSSWIPPTPAELSRLLADRNVRFVATAAQLLAAVCESVDRLEVILHGELPARTNLWDRIGPGVNRPKDEEHLSDTVARHLRDDLRNRGIIANREVQIRRREVPAPAGQAGELLDIRVDAVRPPEAGVAADILSVIVEVKGSWNPEVRTAMQTQLVDRYLSDNQCRTGLYLVGWYGQLGWDDTDGRKNRVPWAEQEAAAQDLRNQATLLTVDGVREVRSYVLDCALR